MDFLKIVFEFAKNHGIGSTILILGLVLACLLLTVGLKNNKIRGFIKKLIRSIPKIEQCDLFNHQLFIQLRRYINYDIQHFVLSEKLREGLFKDFLLFKFTIMQKAFLAFLERGNLEDLSISSYHSKITECYEDIIRSCDTKALESGIPLVVIDKFHEWHLDKIEATYQWINLVCEESVYRTNVERTKIIFDFIVHINNQTILDAKRTLVSLNGSLNNVTYKGISYKSIL